ncbi:unnamed protein product [Mytilus edulis]|uniref:F5/8 type C domain-containing protein n=1 Tax=Mytilus edulis TaxID=6550 RepID=A0A8S3QC08_MYTED|nr:unnamed protein product [Mytilus edulis]
MLSVCINRSVYTLYVLGNNIALGKPTKQLTTFNSYTSERAVDGNSIEWLNQDWNTYACTHSKPNITSELEWWVVDLGGHYRVTNVVIYGRYTPCCSEWLQNYDIDVIEHSKRFGDKWATFQKGRTSLCHYQQPVSLLMNATCPPDVKGRFVRIKRRSNAFPLCLCEVEVYGELITNMTEESNPHKTKAYGFPGKVYNGIFLQKMLVRSNFECTNQCIGQIGCCAGIYNKVTKECSLMRKSDNNEETTHSFHEDADCSSFLI